MPEDRVLDVSIVPAREYDPPELYDGLPGEDGDLIAGVLAERELIGNEDVVVDVEIVPPEE